MKDLFSGHADLYSKYRPGYPPDLISYIVGYCDKRSVAWDCATGNGQLASLLSEHFQHVYATDISDEQLRNAARRSNIRYEKQPAEKTSFPNNFFDLITVAQAYHWFNFETFEKEAKRVAKPGAVISVVGYNLLHTGDEHVNSIIDHFYTKVVGPYWESERKFLEENYNTVPFPFDEITTKEFAATLTWKREDLAGYLRAWSSVLEFIKIQGHDPVNDLMASVDKYWQAGELNKVQFPLFLKLGKISK